MGAKVKGVRGNDVICEVIDGGTVFKHKGVNFPDSALTVSSLTEKDLKDLEFGAKQGVDWVALSFVRSEKEIYDLRYLLKRAESKHGKGDPDHPIRIIAKVEKREAIEHLDEIVEAADGVMVARGDLGIEMPAEEVPILQKRIIDECLDAGKPVIVATQMLDSMIRNPRPTRAEVSDVANAVLDHTDAVMLSGETATGKYPLETVHTMVRIIKEAEDSKYEELTPKRVQASSKTRDEAIAEVAGILAREVKARIILVTSMSGDTARLVSRYRPSQPIFSATDDERVMRQMSLSWGVMPFVLPRCESVEELLERSVGELKKAKYVKKEDRMIVVAGEPVGVSGNINFVEIRDVK